MTGLTLRAVLLGLALAPAWGAVAHAAQPIPVAAVTIYPGEIIRAGIESIGPGQSMNRCRPPSFSMSRWKPACRAAC